MERVFAGQLGTMAERATLLERAENYLANVLISRAFRMFNSGLRDVFKRRFGDDFPDPEVRKRFLLFTECSQEILNNASLIFVNSEPLIDFPKPTVHRVVDIGGIVAHTGHQALNEVL